MICVACNRAHNDWAGDSPPPGATYVGSPACAREWALGNARAALDAMAIAMHAGTEYARAVVDLASAVQAAVNAHGIVRVQVALDAALARAAELRVERGGKVS